MGAFDPPESAGFEDSFEIEFSQLPGASRRLAPPFWRARQPDVVSTSGERRRRNSRVATLMAIACLVFINSFNLTAILPADLPLVSTSLSGGLTAHAAGYSWFKLRQRPLRLPTVASGAPCPVTPLSQLRILPRTVTGIGDSSIFVATLYADANGVQHPERSNFFRGRTTWRGEIVTWYLNLPAIQPVLIRGAQLDGPGILRFDGGIEQPNFTNNIMGGSMLSELLISNTPDYGSPIASWASITRIEHSGCYAYQVDTPSKSVVLVFRAEVEP
jgi:hypothetical protein